VVWHKDCHCSGFLLKNLKRKELWFLTETKKEASEISICQQSNYPTTEDKKLAFGEQLLPVVLVP